MLRYLITLIFSIVFFQSYAQTAKAYEEAGDAAFGRKDYNSALQYYIEASEISSKEVALNWKMGETARLYNSYSLAEKNYQKIIDGKLTKQYPKAKYYLALMKKYQGKYDEAKSDFNEAISDPKTDYESVTAARNEIKSCEWALGIIKTPKDVTVEHLGKNINTPYSEFGAVEDNQTLYYSSMRFENKNDKNDPPRLLTKVLATKDTNVAGKPIPRYNSETQHTAYSAFSKKSKKVFFTNCDYSQGDQIVCSIYFRVNEGDNWSNAERLPDHINFPGASNTMPHVAMVDGQEVLFFVSDRPDGKGKNDIWYSVILPTGSFSYPINLAVINTRGDEMSPFFNSKKNILYFSSDGFESLGGLDIFSTVKTKNNYSTPRNLGTPLNSSYNDLYFNLNEDETSAYFASNRLGSMYLDKKNETCCYDVYKAKIGKKVLDEPKKVPPVANKKDIPKDIPKESSTTVVTKKDNPPSTNTDTPKDKTPSNNSTKVPPSGYTPPPPGTKFDIPKDVPKEYTELEEFIPLPLYFDNDEPDRNTRAVTTSKTYEMAFNSYYKRKYEFIEKNLKNQDRATVITNFDEFFEKTIRFRFTQLQKFTPILLSRLNKGEKVEIIVRGFASPLAKNDYNTNLGKRRVASLLNYWETYENGLLKKFIDNGQLKLTQVSFGEDASANGVSDNQNDEASSIYSIPASKERRIEIIEIKKN